MTITLFLTPWVAQAQEPTTAEDLRAVLTFRDQHLSIREEHEVIPGRVTFMGSGWGWGPGPWTGTTWTSADVVTTPPAVLHSWAVYRGPQRLAVPDFLQAVERDGDARSLELRVRRNASIARVFGGVAIAGLAAGVGGFVGTVADDPERQMTWTGVAIGGLGSSILSGIVSGGTRSRSERLAHDFPETQDLTTSQEEVREYNEELRVELGLAPVQAYRELDAPPRTRPR
jgi:hypothetical protein